MSNPDIKIVDFGCHKKEAVFDSPIPSNKDNEIQNESEQMRCFMEHVAKLNDDRLLALTANLLIENAIDNFLSAIMPNYENEIFDDLDFTIAKKIAIAKALNLVPRKFFDSAKLINEIRNRFAHDVANKSFSDLDKSKITRIEKLLMLFNIDVTANSMDGKFRILTFFTIIGLNRYVYSLSLLNSFLRSANFSEVLAQFKEKIKK